MTDRGEFAERAARLHPDVAYQTDPCSETLTAERAAVLRRLHGRRRVLEVGCASGWFSGVLREHGHDVTGIEGDPRSAERARAGGTRVVVGDAEQATTWESAGNGYDAVLLMHVLEHLADPWEALRRARVRLAPGGVVVSLLPNVASWRVRRALLRGRFDYEDTGVLDRTHLRFFTVDTALALHRAAGFPAVVWEPVQVRAPLAAALRYRLRARRLADRYEAAAAARWPNLCTEVLLVDASG